MMRLAGIRFHATAFETFQSPMFFKNASLFFFPLNVYIIFFYMFLKEAHQSCIPLINYTVKTKKHAKI